MATRTISITEAKANLLRLVTEIAESGDEVVITRRGRPVATLTPTCPPRDMRGWLILPEDMADYDLKEEWSDPVEKFDRIERQLREQKQATRK